VALSPADFYAYSRATGVPVPDSDEERAQMAGDVVNFRRNQLRAPAKEEDQGFNLTNALGIGAAALGLGAGALGLRSVLAKKAAAAAGPVESPVVKYQNIEDLRRAAGYTTAPVRSEAPAPSKVATQEPLGELWEPTVPKEGFARSYLESKGSLLPAAKPDAGDRFIQEYEEEYQRLAKNQARADQRIQAGLREREMQIQGKGERVLAELRKEAADEASVLNDMAEYNRLQGMEQDQPLGRREQRIQQAVTVSQPGQFTDLTNFQENLLGQARNQAMNAVESGEDQQTGRIKAQLQRNEDLDLGQVENLENIAQASGPSTLEQDDAINRAASQLPDGLPVDQAEGIDLRTGERFAIRQNKLEFAPRSTLGSTGLVPAQKILMEQQPQSVANTSAVRFMEAEREKIARELASRDIAAMPQDVDAELARRLGPQASSYGPKYTARAQALQTFANTGSPVAAETVKRFGLSPVTFETFENMPAEKKKLFEAGAPMSLEGYPSEELQVVVPLTGINVNVPAVGRVDISTLRKPVITESTARQANEFIESATENKLNWLESKTKPIEEAKQAIYAERRQRVKETASNLSVELEKAKTNGQQDVVDEINYQLENLRTIYKNPELSDYREFGEGGIRHLNAQLAGMQRTNSAQIAALEKRYPTTLSNRTGEVARVFGETNLDTGELIPETMEVRAGRYGKDLGKKGGGGRNVAEYTAGERLDEEIRAIQGGGRIRDYDLETGAAVQPWQGDRTQTGREVDVYGVRLSGQPAGNPEVRPSLPQYSQQEIEQQALQMSQADPYGDVPLIPDYDTVLANMETQQRTPQRRTSIDVSGTIRRLQSSNAPGAKRQLSQYLDALGVKQIKL
jgi:hypothetical protein